MALFSRRSKKPADPAPPAEPSGPADEAQPVAPAESAEPAAPADESASPAETPAPADATPEATDASAAASVGISMSSFRGVGAAPPPAATPPAPAARPAPEVAPPATETMPGLRDNVLLGRALAGLTDTPTPQQIIDVARQLLQGHLFLRVQGDARSLLSEGKPLPLGIVTIGEESFVVAFSGGAALAASVRADGNAETSAMGQPALTVINHVLGGTHAGLVIDPASMPARAVLRREMLERMVAGIDPRLEVKTLLAGERTAATAPAVVQALTRAPFWVAVSKAGDDGRFGVAEARSPSGERFLEIYSHPLEVVAMDRGDQPAPMNAEQLGKALRADTGITGVVVDPAGPWIRLMRADLGFIISG